LLIQFQHRSLVIDCGPDFRQQMLRAGLSRLDAILITHEHNDHVSGLDDVRPFNFRQKEEMPLYACTRTGQALKKRFDYAFADNPYPGAPRLTIHDINADTTFNIHDLPIQPIEVSHGGLPVLGFRIGDFTYLTDVKHIHESEKIKIKGTKTLVINALHHEPHAAHLNLKEALALIDELQPESAYLTHISHGMGMYEDISKLLPEHVFLAWDQLELNVV
jgi:phosphoribosyl 1,2-cyclic phosphate phosphodiesterase